MNIKTNWPYMVAAICFSLALIMLIFCMVTPVDAAVSVYRALP